jgi:GTP diphosphokinase / guanosine-3',5'-bis(diphosphate) 3'-diphosphatase
MKRSSACSISIGGSISGSAVGVGNNVAIAKRRGSDLRESVTSISSRGKGCRLLTIIGDDGIECYVNDEKLNKPPTDSNGNLGNMVMSGNRLIIDGEAYYDATTKTYWPDRVAELKKEEPPVTLDDNIPDSVAEALFFSANKHKGQVRKNSKSDNYISHPLEVMNFLFDNGVKDESILSAALLHDTVEDTCTTHDEILGTFGKEVADIVREVTDDKSLAKGDRKRLQADTIKDKSFGARMIKIGDKWSNTKDLFTDPPVGWDHDQICGYIIWSKRVCWNAMAPGDTPFELKSKIEEHFRHLGKQVDDLFLEKYYS